MALPCHHHQLLGYLEDRIRMFGQLPLTFPSHARKVGHLHHGTRHKMHRY